MPEHVSEDADNCLQPGEQILHRPPTSVLWLHPIAGVALSPL